MNLIESLLAYWPLVTLLAAVHSLMTASRRLRRGKIAESRSWLAAAPIRLASVRLTRVLTAIAPLLLQWIALSTAAGVIAMIESAAAASAWKLIAALSAGALAGMLLGLWMPQGKSHTPYEGSRYARATRVVVGQPLRPSSAALSRWPVNLTLAWSRPENSRALVVIALLSVQAGSSMLAGIMVVTMWLLAAYLGSLLAAVVHVAREASTWLRSTPMKFHAFAWPIARRALLHQVAGTVLAMGVMIAQDAPLSMALYLGAMWLTLAVLVCAISLAESYRGRSPILKAALSVMALAVIEIREHAWSIVFAALLTAWHWRAGMKS